MRRRYMRVRLGVGQSLALISATTNRYAPEATPVLQPEKWRPRALAGPIYRNARVAIARRYVSLKSDLVFCLGACRDNV